jgi:Reverse transcriptase (RNA-dependent DNA polymerase)
MNTNKGMALWEKGKVINAPEGYKKIRVHLVFDVKHDGRHKARLVADGHLTEEPVEDVYSGVVSLRSLRLVIFLAELNDLELWGADIGNAYLEARTEEKVFIIAGAEFGERQGHILLIHKALYGLRTSGKRFWEILHDELKELGFEPSKADPQVWMRPTKEGDAYEYIAVYVDDLAIAAENCKEICDALKEKCGFKLKGDGPLTYHLGCDYIREPDGVLLATPKKYIGKMLDWYENKYKEKPKKRKTPLEPNDHPELDTSDEVPEEQIKEVQSMVGQFQWLVSLGRFDIFSAVTTLSRYRTKPRQGHVDRCKGLFGYLADKPEAGIRYRTEEPDFSGLPSQVFDWSRSVYGDAKEQLPSDAPLPRGRYVVLTTYVDANLYHDHINGRALTAVLHLINGTPVDWYCKRQATVEAATYGSEFVSARTAVDQIVDLRCSLRYLGVPLRDKSYMFGDNKSVTISCTIPHSPLKKRHHALAYHRVREAIAAGFLAFYHIDGDKNPADILSKHWAFVKVWPMLKSLLFWRGETIEIPGVVATSKKDTQDKGE